jgi:hypothetical protein
MLHRPMSRVLFAVVVCLSLSTMSGPAPADVYFETSYLPTSSVFSLSPTLLPTSYVVPTSYTSTYYPTSYVATSSVVYPTSTTILRRSFFRPWRYVERSYYSAPLATTSYLAPSLNVIPTTYVSASSLLPTTYLSRSYVAPTSYLIDNGVIATSASSSYPCETTSSSPMKAPVRLSNGNGGDSGTSITSSPSNGAASGERRPQGSVSGMAGDDGPSSNAAPTIPAPVQTPPKPAGNATGANPIAEPPAYDPGANTAPGAGANPADSIKIQPPGQTGPGTPPNETTLRTVRRPAFDGRNILRGRVISAESRLPEEGVTVILSNVTRNYTDRPAMTDADGEFKISLPDGDWTVKVKMPSGTVYPVGRDYVTASSGRVIDSSGRNVAQFLITR